MVIVQVFSVFIAILLLGYITGLRPAISFVLDPYDEKLTIQTHIMALGIGLGLITLLITLLALLHVLYSPLVIGILITILILQVINNRAYLTAPPFHWWKELGSFERVLVILCLTFVLFRVLKAGVPTWSSDACLYHMTVPKYFLQYHGIINIPDIVHSNMNGLFGEMGFLLGYLVAGNPGANVMGPIWCLVGALSLCAITAQQVTIGAGLLAALIYLSMPIVFWNSDWQFIDIAATSYSSLFIQSIFLWSKSPRRIPWIPSIFAGLMLGTKVTCGLLALAGLAWILFISFKSSGSRSLRHLIPSWLIFFLIGGFWYLKNWWYTGNPVFPLFFGGKWAPHYVYAHKEGTFYFSNIGALDYWRDAFGALFRNGEFGPYLILALPLLVSCPSVWKKFSWIGLPMLGASALFVIMSLTWETPVIPRFILPYVIFLVIPISCILNTYLDEVEWRRYNVGKILLIVPSMILLLIEVLSFQGWYFIIGKQSKDEFYINTLPQYAAISYVNNKYTDTNRLLYTGVHHFIINNHPISGTVYQGYIDYETMSGYSDFIKTLESLDIKYILFEYYSSLDKIHDTNSQNNYMAPLSKVYQKQLSLMKTLSESGDWRLDYKDKYSVIYSKE